MLESKEKKKVWFYLSEDLERWLRMQAIKEGYNRPAELIEAWVKEKYNKIEKGDGKDV